MATGKKKQSTTGQNELIQKYISHVGWHAGEDFLLPKNRSPVFTDDEWNTLRAASLASVQFDNEFLNE